MSRIIDRAIAEYAAGIESALPESVKRQIELARSDLYNGPVYLDADGDECSMWDEGAIPFSFRAACEAIREALSDVSDVYVTEDGFVLDREPEGSFEPDIDDDGEETETWCEAEPYFQVDANDIVRVIVGRELASYVS